MANEAYWAYYRANPVHPVSPQRLGMDKRVTTYQPDPRRPIAHPVATAYRWQASRRTR